MRAFRRNVLVCALLCACTVGNTGNPSAPDGIAFLRSKLARDSTPDVSGQELERFGADQRALTFALYGQLAGVQPNLFYSPYSIGTALAMTYAGAKGATKDEMAAALHFSLPEPNLHAAFNAVDRALESRAKDVSEGDDGKPIKGDGFRLETNNATFVQRDEQVQDAFLNVLATNYDTGLFIADFKNQPERERKAINAWVAERAEQRVENLLPEMSIDSDTVLVLTNTIYFKGSWRTKFDPAMTESAPFHGAGGDASVPMMHNTARASYARGTGYQAVQLPYLSESVRMLLVLPDEGQLAAVESRLGTGLFDEARAGLSEYMVDLRLPRFSFRAEFELTETLEALGMKRAFGDAADFSGMAGPPGDLYIGNVFHQAFVALDEQGTEAAAATAVVVTRESGAELVMVTFDRPFLFFVYDDPTGQILFAGRLSEP